MPLKRQNLHRVTAIIALIVAPYLGYAGMSVEEIAQFKDLLTKAERGDRGAQELVAIHYELGTGISIDLKEAAHWFRTAAGQDSIMAQFRLGTYYQTAKGWKKIQRRQLSGFEKRPCEGMPLHRSNSANAMNQATEFRRI
jgi:TPR repeat protein